ncbi:hypothetical protein WJX77_007686 [Trebouxia sp. C0004]
MTSIATFHTTAHSLVFTLLLLLLPRESQNFVWAAPALGRATFYGKGDGFTLNDGSCACHKRWGWLSNRCESGHCFDYIGSPLPADGDGLVAAINTPGLSNTGQCGVCYDMTCVDGPTRGAPGAEFPDSGCVSNQTISVMITDSCPCAHANKSNKKWCCGDMTHLDLSYKAFGLIADHDKGVVNIMYGRAEDVMTASLSSQTQQVLAVDTSELDIVSTEQSAMMLQRTVFGARRACVSLVCNWN